jgi:hypothetical protein
MDEEISHELRQKIDTIVEKTFANFIYKVSNGGSLEKFLKILITEKIYEKLGPSMNRYVVKKIANKIISKIVHRVWETHREKLVLKLKTSS